MVALEALVLLNAGISQRLSVVSARQGTIAFALKLSSCVALAMVVLVSGAAISGLQIGLSERASI